MTIAARPVKPKSLHAVEKQPRAKEEKKEVSLLSKINLPGISHANQTGGKVRKAIWTILFVVGFTLTIKQVYETAADYLEYPTVTKVGRSLSFHNHLYVFAFHSSRCLSKMCRFKNCLPSPSARTIRSAAVPF